MATIGLDCLYFAPITETVNKIETYGTPERFAKAITAEISVELNEASLFADDGEAEVVKEFKKGTISLNTDDLSPETAAALCGATIDNNGVVVSRSEDEPPLVAVGFRAKRSDGNYSYFWLYRVRFGIPGNSLATKGDSVTFSTPTIEGTIMRRNKPDAANNHPWKAEVHVSSSLDPQIETNWFSAVYEPSYAS